MTQLKGAKLKFKPLDEAGGPQVGCVNVPRLEAELAVGKGGVARALVRVGELLTAVARFDEARASLSKLRGTVAVCAVAGVYRTGKSYILNQLVGRQSGFGVGASVQACRSARWESSLAALGGFSRFALLPPPPPPSPPPPPPLLPPQRPRGGRSITGRRRRVPRLRAGRVAGSEKGGLRHDALERPAGAPRPPEDLAEVSRARLRVDGALGLCERRFGPGLLRAGAG